MQCPDNAPPWMQWAWKEIGQHELPENRGPVVRKYIAAAHCGEEGEPWCAIFANAALESVGLQGTRSPSSQSFRHSANFLQLSGPSLGAIVVFYRNSRNSGLGHVGFYVGERSGRIFTLGGNESDMVQVEFLAKMAGSFGLVGYYWPKAYALPKIGAVMVSNALPAHQVTVT